MNKSSEIYDIAWDLASIVDNLDDSVLNVICKGAQGTDPNATASLELACKTLKKNIEQMKGLVASLEDITFGLEEQLEELESNVKEKLDECVCCSKSVYDVMKRHLPNASFIYLLCGT